MFAKGSRHDDRHAIKPLTNVSFQQARIIVREMIENKLPIGPAPLRRSFQFFDENGSGAIDIHEFKRALHMKANIAFEQSMLEKLMAFYDDDSSGSINFRKFCENVMDSRVGQADCITKVKPQGQKNVVSSDAGTSEPFLKRKIQMEKKNLRMAFKARDSTGLGVVKVTDLRELLEKYDINMTDNQFATLVTQMDHNGDGVITYAEFLRYFSRDLDATTGELRCRFTLSCLHMSRSFAVSFVTHFLVLIRNACCLVARLRIRQCSSQLGGSPSSRRYKWSKRTLRQSSHPDLRRFVDAGSSSIRMGRARSILKR